MDFVLRTGDQAIFDPVFGVATVVAPPGVITGSSRAKIDGAAICMQGDEATVIVAVAAYSSLDFPTSGTGVLTIESLASDQIATASSSTKRPKLLRGSRFRARLRVTMPATTPDGTLKDSVGRIYSGTGAFVTANTKVRSG
jgi:Contractile injection system spike tip protein